MTVAQRFGHDTSEVSEANFEAAFGGAWEGVFAGMENECKVVENAALVVDVGTGRFITGGVFGAITAAESVTLDTADGSNPRIDRIICKRDNSADIVTVEKLTGTPGASPSPPALTRSGGVWETSLAQVYVDTAAASVGRADIADERADPDVCGLIIPGGMQTLEHNLIYSRGQWGRLVPGHSSAFSSSGLFGNTVQEVGTGSNGAGGYGWRHDETSAAAIGANAGWFIDAYSARGNFNSLTLIKFQLPSIADIRTFVGFSESGSVNLLTGADAPASTEYCGIQFSTPRGDSTWQFSSSDGSTQTLTDSHVAASTTALYVRIGLLSTGIYKIEILNSDFNVVGGRYLTSSDKIPAVNTGLTVLAGLETRVNGAKTFSTYHASLLNRI